MRTKHLAELMRRKGFHRVPRKDLEAQLGREFTYQERWAYNMACDSRTHTDPLKRQHSNRNARARDSMQLKYASTSKGKSAGRIPKGVGADTHTPRLPERAHSLRARYTDEPNPTGNLNEQRLARIVSAKQKRPSEKDGCNTVPAHTFRHVGSDLTRSSRGNRVINGVVERT